MATKLYLLATANALTGTFPASEQSSQVASWSMVGADPLLTMRDTKGTGQGAFSGTSLASTSAQKAFCGHFASETLNAAQSVGGGSNSVTLNIANRESSLSMNFGTDLRCHVYVWRPSTGAKVGTVCDNLASTGSQEPGATSSTRSNASVTTGTSTVSALAGDVIVCEIWQYHTQASATAYTASVYANGTTETLTVNTVVTNHASFLEFSADTLTFGAPAGGISASLAVTLDNDSTSSSSSTEVVGQSAMTAQADSLSAQSVASVIAASSMAMQGDAISSVSAVTVQGSASLDTHDDSVGSQAGGLISAALSVLVQPDSVQASSVVTVGASSIHTQDGDSIASSGHLEVVATSALQDGADVSSSLAILQISTESDIENTADIMSASVSVGGELYPSTDRTLFIGAQARINSVNAQIRETYAYSQSRAFQVSAQNRLNSPSAQNRTATPEPQNRNIAE